jgi:L-fuculose-phosphate aldolase
MFQWIAFRSIGKSLFDRGLNNSHSGNISTRHQDKITITATGTMLHKLNWRQLVSVGIQPDAQTDKKASMELRVHRAIYKANPEIKAIIHAHCPYAVAMANGQTTITPYDDEGRYYFKTIPILNVENTISSQEVEDQMPALFNKANAVILNRHGVFAVGKTLEEAFKYLTVVESVCMINYIVETR